MIAVMLPGEDGDEALGHRQD